MFPEFATTYRDKDNNVHLYVFLGIDDDGKQIYRNIDLSSLDKEYTYTKNSDKSYDFQFKDDISKLVCKMIHIKTGETKTFVFEDI